VGSIDGGVRKLYHQGVCLFLGKIGRAAECSCGGDPLAAPDLGVYPLTGR